MSKIHQKKKNNPKLIFFRSFPRDISQLNFGGDYLKKKTKKQQGLCKIFKDDVLNYMYNHAIERKVGFNRQNT